MYDFSVKIALDKNQPFPKQLENSLAARLSFVGRSETDYIYTQKHGDNLTIKIKLRDNDAANVLPNAKVLIYEQEFEDYDPLCRARLVEVSSVAPEIFAKTKEELGTPDIIIEKNRRIYTSTLHSSLRIYHDQCIYVTRGETSPVLLPSDYLEFQINYADIKTQATAKAFLFECLEKVNFTQDKIEKRSYNHIAAELV